MLSGANIKHVFVLMLENRSFDHLLGFSGITGTDAVSLEPRTIPTPTGSNRYREATYTQATPAINPMPVDPGHEFTDTVEELCGPGVKYPRGGPYPPITNSGYVANYMAQPGAVRKPSPSDPLRCCTTAQVPVLTELAKRFVLCDGWWSSMPGPTWPNRLFLHAASSGGLDHTPSKKDIEWYAVFGYGFQHGTIFDRLYELGLPWRIYQGDAVPLALALKGMTKYLREGHFADYADFAEDLQKGYEPVYTFIEPSYGAWWGDFTCGTSQHPLDDIARGEWLITCTYEAIRNSPVWESSLLIVTWDEHGGFYAHAVPPGEAPAPGDVPVWPENNESGFTFTQYGVRVPAVVVSPLIPANMLDGRLYDHTSVLSTLAAIFKIPSLTKRDELALNLTSLGTLSTPRTDAPARLPDPPPPAKLSGCGPLSGCGSIPALEASRAQLAAPVEDGPLTGNQPGFVYVALMRDLAASPESEHAQRRERAASVETREQARAYLAEVLDRAAQRS